MTQAPQSAPAPGPRADDALSLVSAYGTYRVVMALLALWSFFAGFSLLTHGVGALTFGDDGGGGRAAGGFMIVLAPVYALLAWRRREYRMLAWLPYAAQLAVMAPVLWERDGDGVLLFIVSLIFLVLLVYVWWSSHPLGFFQPGDDADDDDADMFEDEEDDDLSDAPEEDSPRAGRRYRRTK